MHNELIKVGITHGDINGIGYELLLKTFSDTRMTELCSAVVYGSSKVAAYYRKALNLPAVNLNIVSKAEEVRENRMNLINCLPDDEATVEMGESRAEAGLAAEKSLRAAAEDLERHALDALVTLPVNIQNLRSETFPYASQDQFLEETLKAEDTLLIFIKDELRVAAAIDQTAVKDVASKLSVELLTRKLTLLNDSLKKDFNIVKPRIAVLAFNSSGVEGLVMGDEENVILKPAMEKVEQTGVMSFGPYQADDFFGSMQYTLFDGVLAMYYDQAIPAFKTMTSEEGYVFTAGLPRVCTAPAHGVLYELTGKNEYSEASLRQALYGAIDIFRNRKEYEKNTARPLRRQYYDRGEDNEKLDLTSEEGQ